MWMKRSVKIYKNINIYLTFFHICYSLGLTATRLGELLGNGAVLLYMINISLTIKVLLLNGLTFTLPNSFSEIFFFFMNSFISVGTTMPTK
jgi:hypothetical protein